MHQTSSQIPDNDAISPSPLTQMQAFRSHHTSHLADVSFSEVDMGEAQRHNSRAQLSDLSIHAWLRNPRRPDRPLYAIRGASKATSSTATRLEACSRFGFLSWPHLGQLESPGPGSSSQLLRPVLVKASAQCSRCFPGQHGHVFDTGSRLQALRPVSVRMGFIACDASVEQSGKPRSRS